METLLSINYESRDVLVLKSHNISVYVFYGQPLGGRNHWITRGSTLIQKMTATEWMYIGRVIAVDKMMPAEGIDRFLLVVDSNENTGRTARTKQMLMRDIGFVLTDVDPGIAHITHA